MAYLFTSESVSEGHPDKVADLISDAVLDAVLTQDPMARVAAETLTNTGLVVLAGEITSHAKVDYIKVARETLKSIPTYNINMDSIYRLQDLRFLKSEINGTVPLDEKLGEKCKEIAKSLGYNIPSMNMPFGGGSTDAAEFAKAGIPALSIIGLDTTFTSGDVPYHTNFDTVDKIEPKAVLACMQIAEQFILEIDNPS